MSDTADLHIYDQQSRSLLPYRCTSCGGVGWTQFRQPRCEGTRHRMHGTAAMVRIPATSAPSADTCPRLVLR